MKKVELKICFEEYANSSELNTEDHALLMSAIETVEKAYAPYSQYYVGAALKLKNGRFVQGNNQENVAYPSGLCAERVAIFYASAKYPDMEVDSIAITAKAKNFKIDEVVAPCGACRQVLAEYEMKQNKPIRIILQGDGGKVLIFKSIEDILPLMFHAEELKK
jgi:cytidine deaminase